MPQCRKTEFLREILFTDGKNYVIISKQNLIFITQSGDYINMKRVLTLIMALTLLCCSGCCGGKKSQIMPTAAEVINQEPEKLNYSDVHAPVDAKWFDDAVLVGDSVTLKLSYYCESHPEALGQAQFFCAGSLGYTNALWDIDREDAVHPYYKGATHLSEECAEQTGAKKVFVMLGMNDVGLYGADGALQSAKTLIANILKRTPDVLLYVQSTTPILQGHESGTFSNETIRTFNKSLEDYCKSTGYKYLDIHSQLVDEQGYLKPEYCSDPDSQGIHFTDEACQIWVDYLKNNV